MAATIVVLAAAFAALRGGHGGPALVVTCACFAVLMLAYMGLAFASLSRDFRAVMRRDALAPLGLAAAFMGIYVVYAWGTGSFDLASFGRLAAFAVIPSLLVMWSGTSREPTWQDAFAVALIWIPFDTGYLRGIWSWPAGEGAYVFNTAIATILATALFAGRRRFEGLSARFRLSADEAKVAVVALLGFLVIALPFGFASGFITVNPKLDPVKVIGSPLGILLFIAVPEELLFRGLVQNFLEKWLKNPWLALALASVFFGLTHLNNGPEPDFRYVVLATIAGGFYGYTYMRARRLFAPALVHAAVDTIWVLFFYK